MIFEDKIQIRDEFWHVLNTFKRMIRKAETHEVVSYGHRLFSFLIEPVKYLLTGKNRLIIIPDHNLSDLPFEALVSSSCARSRQEKVPRFLIEDYEVVYHRPELEFARLICRKTRTLPADPVTANYSLIGIVPREGFYGPGFLPDVLKELDTIGNIFRRLGMPVCLVPGNHKMHDCIQTSSDRVKIIHLAAHYRPWQIQDDRAGFLLHGTGGYSNMMNIRADFYNRLSELVDLNTEADLIVLNACKSGYLVDNSGIAKNMLPPMLIHAGASHIISTLWNVPDKLAKQFMVAFYRILLKGSTYSNALREVKLMMIRNRKTSLPTVWAPYILTASD